MLFGIINLITPFDALPSMIKLKSLIRQKTPSVLDPDFDVKERTFLSCMHSDHVNHFRIMFKSLIFS